MDFAIEASARKKSSIKKPAVVGAVVDLGLCLDMTTLGGIDMIRAAYQSLTKTFEAVGQELPTNSLDLLRRNLDRAVIQRLHSILEQEGTSLDTVRGVFIEGSPIYPNSGFNEKTHIQIAVRNVECIKGVFRVSEKQLHRWRPSG